MVIKKSNIHGKGVFSTTPLAKGQILQCDVLPISGLEPLLTYAFVLQGSDLCIHIGFATYLNASGNPNVKHLRVDSDTLVSYFEVLKDISSNEELTLSYTVS